MPESIHPRFERLRRLTFRARSGRSDGCSSAARRQQFLRNGPAAGFVVDAAKTAVLSGGVEGPFVVSAGGLVKGGVAEWMTSIASSTCSSLGWAEHARWADVIELLCAVTRTDLEDD